MNGICLYYTFTNTNYEEKNKREIPKITNILSINCEDYDLQNIDKLVPNFSRYITSGCTMLMATHIC
jgi:hypothetical protein